MGSIYIDTRICLYKMCVGGGGGEGSHTGVDYNQVHICFSNTHVFFLRKLAYMSLTSKKSIKNFFCDVQSSLINYPLMTILYITNNVFDIAT